MKVAVFEDIGKITLKEYELPNLKSNEILVEIRATAICTWEQRVFEGVKKVSFPFVGGHEIAGEIVAVGSNINKRNWKIGDRVVYGTNLACGDCTLCKLSEEQNCLNFNHEKDISYLPNLRGMGGFATHIITDAKNLFKFENVSFEEACLVEPISCVHQSISRSEAKMGETALVMGCGIMGQLHIKLAKKLGLKIIAVDLNEQRLIDAKENGADIIINPNNYNLDLEILNLTDGAGVDIIYNTVANAHVAEYLMNLLGVQGRHILYSSFYPPIDMKINPDMLHKKAQKIIGTANSNSRDFTLACRMLSNNQISVKNLISEVYDLEDIEEAINVAVNSDNYRIVIKNMKEGN